MSEKLSPEQMKRIWELSNQHPKTWTKGAWYPATHSELFNGEQLEIKRTSAKGNHYLNVRRKVTVKIKSKDGEVIGGHEAYEVFCICLSNATMTYKGW